MLDDLLSICLKLRHVRFIAPSLTFLWAHNTQARVLLILLRALYTRLLVTVNHRRSISQDQTPIVIIVFPLTPATIVFLLFKRLHLFFLRSCRTSSSLLRFLQHRRLLRRLNFLRSKRVKILHLLVPCSLAHGVTVVAQMSIRQLLIYGVWTEKRASRCQLFLYLITRSLSEQEREAERTVPPSSCDELIYCTLFSVFFFLFLL